MRRVGCKTTKLVERRLEAGERIVDDSRKPADFVVLIRYGEAFVQPLGGNAPGLGRQMIDGRERPPRQQVPADSSQHHDNRKAEHENDEHFPQLGSQPRFGPRHSQHDRASANQGGTRKRPPWATIRNE